MDNNDNGMVAVDLMAPAPETVGLKGDFVPQPTYTELKAEVDKLREDVAHHMTEKRQQAEAYQAKNQELKDRATYFENLANSRDKLFENLLIKAVTRA